MAQRRRSPADKQDDDASAADDREPAEDAPGAAVEPTGSSGEGASATPPSLSREDEARLRQKLRAKYH
jgi:hypothetical protein